MIQTSSKTCRVDVFTRRDSPLLLETAKWEDGVRIIHVPAVSPAYVRKEAGSEQDNAPVTVAITSPYAHARQTIYDVLLHLLGGLERQRVDATDHTSTVATVHSIAEIPPRVRTRTAHRRPAVQPSARRS